MSDYTPPPGAERFAERFHRFDAESARQRRRMEDAPTEELTRVLLDRDELVEARLNALGFLFERRDAGSPDLLLDLIDDPEEDIAGQALMYCDPSKHPEVTERLHALLDDPRAWAWSGAACTLARRRPDGLLPRLRDWFGEGDEPHRNVAIEYFPESPRSRGAPAACRIL